MERFDFEVEILESPTRIDRWLTDRIPGYSRSKIQRLISDGSVLVDEERVKPGFLVSEGCRVSVQIESQVEDESARTIPIDVLYKDEHVVVVNKQWGLVVHPGIENQQGTLVQALLAQGFKLAAGSGPDRPGVVHRLDKETSGVMILAKSGEAYVDLVEQFSEREVDKFYVALVHGKIESNLGRIEAPIGRDVKHPAKMAISKQSGREASTEFIVLGNMNEHTAVLVKLLTGRTHQIRVHFDAIGHPVMGDKLYGTSGKPNEKPQTRMMLHAWKLRVDHPETRNRLEFTAPLPSEVENFLPEIDLDGALSEFESS